MNIKDYIVSIIKEELGSTKGIQVGVYSVKKSTSGGLLVTLKNVNRYSPLLLIKEKKFAKQFLNQLKQVVMSVKNNTEYVGQGIYWNLIFKENLIITSKTNNDKITLDKKNIANFYLAVETVYKSL